MIQRRLAWLLHKDDRQIHQAFHKKKKKRYLVIFPRSFWKHSFVPVPLSIHDLNSREGTRDIPQCTRKEQVVWVSNLLGNPCDTDYFPMRKSGCYFPKWVDAELPRIKGTVSETSAKENPRAWEGMFYNEVLIHSLFPLRPGINWWGSRPWRH